LRVRVLCWGTLVALLLSTAGGAESSPEPAPPEASADAASSEPRDGESGRNLLMGTGEPLEPAPFTLEQRFLHAVRKGDRSTVERALELGVSVDTKDDLGRSALLLAARDAGSLELVRFLRERGAAVDEPDLGGRTALSFAAGKGRLELVRYLVSQGAAVDRADHQGRTPLFHAVFGNHVDVVSFLLGKGAEVNPRDQFLDTPLMAACAKGLGEMAELLLTHGADPALRDQEGRTARERAAPGTAPCLRPPSTAAPEP
jgi:ankyrin repeat protein